MTVFFFKGAQHIGGGECPAYANKNLEPVSCSKEKKKIKLTKRVSSNQTSELQKWAENNTASRMRRRKCEVSRAHRHRLAPSASPLRNTTAQYLTPPLPLAFFLSLARSLSKSRPQLPSLSAAPARVGSSRSGRPSSTTLPSSSSSMRLQPRCPRRPARPSRPGPSRPRGT